MILAINTASDENSIALYSDQIQKERTWKSYMTQSQELLPRIEKFLKSNKVKLSNIQAVAVYQGPGSYTGLRVSISVANAFGWSLNIPVIGIQTKSEKLKTINALDIAKQAHKIFTTKKLAKFTQPAEVVYQNKL